MKKKSILFLSILFYISILPAQDIIIENENGLVSPNAYSKKISKDFSYLLLGDNSPQQGISATLNEKKSNIKINGLLYSGNSGIISMELDLSASNGIYFFDNENGSEQGKVSINYYRKIAASSEFYRATTISKISVKLEILELLSQTKSDYINLRNLIINKIDSTLIEDEDKDKAIIELIRLTQEYINIQNTLGYDNLEERKFDNKAYSQNSSVSIELKEILTAKQIKNNLLISNNGKIKLSKLLKDYTIKRNYILKNLQEDINNLELKSAETQWSGNHIWFVGISPFYERQSLKSFSYDNSKTFSDMFSSERGNVYGVVLSLNYSLEKGEASKSKIKPENLFVRLSVSLSRASNISNFRNSTLSLTTPLGNDVNGNPVVFTNLDNAFIGDASFEYGFANSITLETYYYPFKIPIGLFGQINYNKIRFNRESDLKDKEIYPMRIGLLFSLKNKIKNKPLITIQAFIDRTDLNLKPTKPDSDLRFGLGIGVPLNFN